MSGEPAARSGDAAGVAGVRSVLFVCLGNICRSPLAQGVFEHLAEARGVREDLVVESCGTGSWHVGQRPDPRSLAVAKRHGVRLRSRARVLDPTSDFRRFELVVPMDRQNLASVLRAGCPAERAALLLSFAPASLAERHAEPMRTLEVPDPYHDDDDRFEEVHSLLHAACGGLLDAMLAGRA